MIKSKIIFLAIISLQLAGCGNMATHKPVWYNMHPDNDYHDVKLSIDRCKAEVDKAAAVSGIKPLPYRGKDEDYTNVLLYEENQKPDYQKIFESCMEHEHWGQRFNIDYWSLNVYPYVGTMLFSERESIFYGEKLLTNPNPEMNEDKDLFQKLGISAA